MKKENTERMTNLADLRGINNKGGVFPMRNIVINACFGGFGLSEEASAMLGGVYDWDVSRDDPKLVEVVEKLGSGANGECAELKVIQIPEDVDWEIKEYDGNEHVAEKHRTWR